MGEEIVNLAYDSERQQVLHDVAGGCLLANDQHVYYFSRHRPQELHHCHRELRELPPRVSSAIESETHEIDGLANLRLNLQVKDDGADESSDQDEWVVLHGWVIFNHVVPATLLAIFLDKHEVEDDPSE